MRVFWVLVLCFPAVLLAASFGGGIHPVGDSLAVFRLYLLAATGLCAVLLLWLRAPQLAGFAGVLALIAAIPVATMMRIPPAPDGPHLTIYSKNLLALNINTTAVADDILASGADLVLLQEVSDRNIDILQLLAAQYSHSQFCRFSGWSGMAVLSQLPSTGARFCADWRGYAGLRVETEIGPVWAISVHQSWPWPYGQPAQLTYVTPRLAALDGPIVLGGDFNMAPWGHSVRRLQTLTNTVHAGPLMQTIRPSGLPLPIDFVLAPGGGTATRRPQLGSDHHGILARVALTP